MANKSIRTITRNKKAFHDYFILETIKAGIELKGTEVKSMRQSRCNLKDSYIIISNKEAFIKGMHISPFEQGNRFNHDPLRDRRLLLHKYEINKLEGSIMQQGLTIVPLQAYFEGSLVKLDIGVARGKKLFDKRRSIAEKDFKLKLMS